MLKLKMEWNLGLANSPEVDFDSPMNIYEDDFLWEEIETDDALVYLGYLEELDLYTWLFWNKARKPSSGFGGRTFSLKMKGGGAQKVHGPWAGAASSVNSILAKVGRPERLAALGERFGTSRETVTNFLDGLGIQWKWGVPDYDKVFNDPNSLAVIILPGQKPCAANASREEWDDTYDPTQCKTCSQKCWLAG